MRVLSRYMGENSCYGIKQIDVFFVRVKTNHCTRKLQVHMTGVSLKETFIFVLLDVFSLAVASRSR